MGAWRLYWMVFNVSLQSKLEYRVDFLLGILTSTMLQFAALGFLWVVFNQTPALNGWTGTQVVFLFGMTAMSLGLSELLFNQIWGLPNSIVMGDLDRLLVYPVHSLFFLLISSPVLHSFGNILTGAILTFAALARLHMPLTAYLWVPLWAICGCVIYTSALVAFACLSFKWVGPYAHNLNLTQVLLNANRYPLTIYPGWLQAVLMFLVPYGAFCYLPAASLFEKGVGPWGLLIAPLAALVSMAIANAFWNWGIRCYESTGS